MRVTLSSGRRSTTPLRGSPIAVVAGLGAVWALDTDGVVSKLDARNGRVTTTIATGAAAPYNLWIGGGSLWSVDDATGTVLRIDPARRKVVARIPVGDGPADMVFRGARAWVINHRDLGLVAIDTATNRPRKLANVPGDAPERLAWAAGSLWVTGRGTDLLRLDPATGAVTGDGRDRRRRHRRRRERRLALGAGACGGGRQARLPDDDGSPSRRCRHGERDDSGACARSCRRPRAAAVSRRRPARRQHGRSALRRLRLVPQAATQLLRRASGASSTPAAARATPSSASSRPGGAAPSAPRAAAPRAARRRARGCATGSARPGRPRGASAPPSRSRAASARRSAPTTPRRRGSPRRASPPCSRAGRPARSSARSAARSRREAVGLNVSPG